jgi:hypothetical protein
MQIYYYYYYYYYYITPAPRDKQTSGGRAKEDNPDALNNSLFDTSIESESASMVTSG